MDEQNRLEIKPGFVVLNTTEAVGGIHYRRTEHEIAHEGDGTRSKWATEKLIDHASVCEAVDKVRHQVEYLIKSHGTRTGFGWYVDALGKSRIEAGLVPLRVEADRINRWARAERAERRIHIGCVFAALDVATPEVAQECYRRAREILRGLRDALATGQVGEGALGKWLQKSRNLGAFAPGLLAIAVTDALARVDAAKGEVKAAIKAGATPAEAGAALDLDALDAAIEVFGGQDDAEVGA